MRQRVMKLGVNTTNNDEKPSSAIDTSRKSWTVWEKTTTRQWLEEFGETVTDERESTLPFSESTGSCSPPASLATLCLYSLMLRKASIHPESS